tara:strand:+ start:527 stop:934 length:408 start_codon:yes stop_codon:yes gene_type:complete
MLKKIKNNINYKLSISLFVLTLAIVYLGVMTIQNSKTYYLTIDEIQNTNPESLNSFRVAGKLILDSYNREKDSTMSTFNITDDGKILQASYTGVLPDMFFSSKSEQIILEGKLVGNGELFEAENVIVKCPSKYEE